MEIGVWKDNSYVCVLQHNMSQWQHALSHDRSEDTKDSVQVYATDGINQ